jgi:hypothetical protein
MRVVVAQPGLVGEQYYHAELSEAPACPWDNLLS